MRCITLVLLGISGALYSKAQPDTSKIFVKVVGEVARPLNLYARDLAGMTRSSVSVADKEGKNHVYTGVSLQAILQRAGVSMGKELRGENLTKYLLVKSSDGYRVLFSLAEIDSSFTDRVVILANETDGKPLPAGKGPFRLIVPGEKKLARSSFQVTELLIGSGKE